MELVSKHSRTIGLPPGTIVYVGEKRTGPAMVAAIKYDESSVFESGGLTPHECHDLVNATTNTWINVVGLQDVALLEQFGASFAIHPLTLEDIVNTSQRPKLEDHDDYVFIVLKIVYRSKEDDRIVSEQVSLLLGKNHVLSFQEVDGPVFGTIRDRIRAGKGRIRRMGADYLAYSLIDAIVDNYFVLIEDLSEKIESVQETVVGSGGPETLEEIHLLKRELLFARRNLWPLRELVNGLSRIDTPLIDAAIAPYLRDVNEHTFQIIDSVESLRDMLSGALEIYMSSASNRLNEVMKVLTVISTIFMPLTFIVGVYGMNFHYMPELQWHFSYPMLWAVMLAIAVGMYMFFRRRHWL